MTCIWPLRLKKPCPNKLKLTCPNWAREKGSVERSQPSSSFRGGLVWWCGSLHEHVPGLSVHMACGMQGETLKCVQPSYPVVWARTCRRKLRIIESRRSTLGLSGGRSGCHSHAVPLPCAEYTVAPEAHTLQVNCHVQLLIAHPSIASNGLIFVSQHGKSSAP